MYSINSRVGNVIATYTKLRRVVVYLVYKKDANGTLFVFSIILKYTTRLRVVRSFGEKNEHKVS
jgi:hypothetical protein